MAVLLRLSTVILLFVTAIYFFASKIIFDHVYATTDLVVDEEFHLPLGKAYCNYDFYHWDPKVTTLPGLYLLTSLVMGYFNYCSTYWLRFISLICSTINILLFYRLFSVNNREAPWKNILSAVNLALLPPLYFFSHLYYTDVPSIMMTLSLILFSKLGHHYSASLFGAMAVIMRQTNIVWVALSFTDYFFKECYRQATNKAKNLKYLVIPWKGLKTVFLNIICDPLEVIERADVTFHLYFTSYLTVILTFLLFVYINGSITVGDYNAHEATLHIPQLFYFVLFTLIFAWPHFLSNVVGFVRFATHRWIFTTILILIFTLIVCFGTLVHPYMLADNRHYLFYIWNRFYGKYVWFKYAMVPIYIFGLYGILTKIWNTHDASFPFLFLTHGSAVLMLQRLVEIRYFLIPYILFRIQIKTSSSYVLLLETFTYLIINFITLYIFFTKTIEWDEYVQPQRLIW